MKDSKTLNSNDEKQEKKEKKEKKVRDRSLIPKEEQKAIVATVGLTKRNANDWYKLWLSKIRTSRYRDIKCTLTFKQYVKLAVRAGLTKPSQIGSRPGKYCLGRKGDIGGYIPKNCRFILVEDNLKEIYTNGRMDSAIRISANRRLGKTKHTLESIRRQSEKMTGRTKQTHKGLAIVADKISKNYRIVSPYGKVYKGRNLKEACLKLGLNQAHMSAVCRGAKEYYKGWTGSYYEKV